MKILVVGIRGEHLHKLKKVYPSVNFVALTDQDVHHTFKHLETYDHIFSLWRFTNHTTEVNCSSHPSYHRVNSYSILRQQIEKVVKS
jgi:hypothetical protein